MIMINLDNDVKYVNEELGLNLAHSKAISVVNGEAIGEISLYESGKLIWSVQKKSTSLNDLINKLDYALKEELVNLVLLYKAKDRKELFSNPVTTLEDEEKTIFYESEDVLQDFLDELADLIKKYNISISK